MSLCENCGDVKIEYLGDGKQNDYTFSFEYYEEKDVNVVLWDEDNDEWYRAPNWFFMNPTTVRIPVAPEDGQRILIYRCTDLDALAEFYPGTPIKAKELNDNFFLVENAIEEARCLGGDGEGGGSGTGKRIFEADNKAGKWVDGDLNTDEYLPTAPAVTDRLDPFFQDSKPAEPNTWRMPGKVWFDNDSIKTRVWDQENGTWVESTLIGQPGKDGASANVSENAPTDPAEGDLWWADTDVNDGGGRLYIWTGSEWVDTSILANCGDSDHSHASDTPPADPTNGDIWVDTSECPPVLKVYTDEAECPGEGGWHEIQGGGDPSVPIDPTPGDGNNTINPPVSGSGTETDPYVLTADTVNYGGAAQTVEVISFTNQNPGDFVLFVDQNDSDNGTRFSQPAGVIGTDGTWSGRLVFNDTPVTSSDTDYVGLLKIGSTSIYYSWTITCESGVIPPPVITQEPVISSDTNETTDPITVDTRAAVTEATFTSSTWIKDNAVIPGANSTTSYTPIDPGTYKFREVFTGNDGSTVNADSNVLVITEKPVEPDGPNATMHGLRFDNDRNTYLENTLPAGDINKFTFSAWIKRPLNAGATGVESTLISANPTSETKIYFNNNDRIFITNSGVTLWNSDPITIDNTWFHLCIAFDSTQSSGANRCKVWINGEEIPYDFINIPLNQSLAFGAETPHLVGKASNGRHFDGYLSDVYFLGRPVNVNTFGKSFEGKWGPLDSSDVIPNIAGGTVNYDKTWSDLLSPDGPWRNDAPKTNAFDGNASTNVALEATASTLTFVPDLGDGPFDVEYKGFNDGQTTVSIDGEPLTYVESSIWTGTVSSFNTMTMSTGAGNRPGIAYIKVNGRILIDGPADNSRVWSDNTTSTNPCNRNDATLAFNGTFVEREGACVNTTDSNPNESITVSGLTLDNSKVKVYYGVETGYINIVKVTAGNKEDTNPVPDASGNFAVNSVTLEGCTGSTVSLDFQQVSGSASGYFYGIEVDGKLLVNGGSFGDNGFYLPFDPEAGIGTDASGQGNNFVDENFAVGNTNKIWSQYVTTDTSLITPENGFNGSLADSCSAAQAQGGGSPSQGWLIVDLSSESPSGHVRISGSATTTVVVTGDTTETKLLGVSQTYVDIGTVNNIQTIRFDNSTNNGAAFNAIQIGGSTLINTNIQDTVLDTPMKNYAVLMKPETDGYGSSPIINGSLVTNGAPGIGAISNIAIDKTKKYYFEVTTAGASNCGIGVLDGDTILSNPGSGPPANVYGMFSYNTGTYSFFNNGTSEAIQGSVADAGDVIGLALDFSTRDMEFFVNGSSVGTYALGGTGNLPYYLYCMSGANAAPYKIAVNFGQQPLAYPQAGYESLYRTWQDYARTTLGYLEQRIAKLEQRNQRLESLVAEARTRLAALELNEISDDAVDTALITLIGSINDRLTVLENN